MKLNIRIHQFIKLTIAAKDLPLFPVIDRLLIAVKERVNIARDIDKLGLHCRRDNSKRGWLEKAAEELDLILDEDQMLVV